MTSPDLKPATSQEIPGEQPKNPSLEHSTDKGITPRVIFLSLLLGVFFGYVNPNVDFRFFNTYLGGSHLPAGAVGTLLILLVIVNPLLRLISQRFAFSRNETLTIYITCLFSCLVPGRGGENFWIPNVIASFYYATSENKWLNFLEPHLKPWMTPALSNGSYEGAGRAAIEGWYTALPEGAPIPWGVWVIPLLAWTAIVLALYGMLCCLGVMLRAQWADREALAFPLLRLPLEMTQHLDAPGNKTLSSDKNFFANPIMWAGVGVAVFLESLNGLNLYFPEVPTVPMQLDDVRAYLSEPPWNQITVNVGVLPLVLGVSYLLTSEVSFSLWFFFLFTKFQLILAYYMGLNPNAMPNAPWATLAKPFISYQQIGAYFAYSGLVLWIGREHLGYVFRRALGREKANAREKEEPLSYPVAFWGFVLCFAFIIGWTTAAGVRLDIALIMWLTYLVVAIGLTRVVVEGGLIMVHAGWAPLGPWAHLLGGGPNSWVTPASALPAATITNALMYEMRGFLLPSFVQSFKLAHDRRIRLKPLLALIVATILVTMTVSWLTIIWMGYEYGGLQLPGARWWAKAGSWSPTTQAMEFAQGMETNYAQNWFWMGFGATLTWIIMVARSRFLWFPLHPIGYLMSTPYAIHWLWFPIFLAWLCKVVITRYGGNEAYRRMIPAFLGLALGEVAMMVIWVAIDCWQGRNGHILMPG